MDVPERIIESLSTLGAITCRPMFGGHGLDGHETIFILSRDRLSLKVDARTKGDYLVSPDGKRIS